MVGFLRRLFGGGGPPQARARGHELFLDVACERCDERFHLYINRAIHCLQVFDEPAVAWRLEREVVGARCRTVMQVRIDFAPDGQIVRREIAHGRFLTPEEL